MDERAALEELERLQQQIRHYRSQRQAVDEQFEQFIRSFKTAPEAAGPPAAAPAPVPATPSIQSLEPSSLFTAPVPVPVSAPPARRPKRPRTGVMIGGTLVLLAAGALATWTLRPRAPESPATGTATPIATPGLPAVPEPSPVTVVAGGSSLTTSRAVWVRVLADGERVLERELPANTHVPLKAEKTIVIRTGDAGAIRLTLRGQDQGLLGGAGEVVTRTFSVPPPQAGR